MKDLNNRKLIVSGIISAVVGAFFMGAGSYVSVVLFIILIKLEPEYIGNNNKFQRELKEFLFKIGIFYDKDKTFPFKEKMEITKNDVSEAFEKLNLRYFKIKKSRVGHQKKGFVKISDKEDINLKEQEI